MSHLRLRFANSTASGKNGEVVFGEAVSNPDEAVTREEGGCKLFWMSPKAAGRCIYRPVNAALHTPLESEAETMHSLKGLK